MMVIDVRGVRVLQGVRDGRERSLDFIGHHGLALGKALEYALFRDILCDQVAPRGWLLVVGQQAIVEAFGDVAMLQLFERLRAREKSLPFLICSQWGMEDVNGAVIFAASLLFAQVDGLKRGVAHQANDGVWPDF